MIKRAASALMFQFGIAVPGAFFVSAFGHHQILFVMGWLVVAQLVLTHGVTSS